MARFPEAMQEMQNVQQSAASVVQTISDQRTRKEKHNLFPALLNYAQNFFIFF